MTEKGERVIVTGVGIFGMIMLAVVLIFAVVSALLMD
jgi:hypothetical protein